MIDEEVHARGFARAARKFLAELDRAGLGCTPAALHMTLAADDLECRAGAERGDAVYFVAGDDESDDPAWGFSPLFQGSPSDVLSWLRSQPSLSQLSVITSSNKVLWASEYLEQASGDK